MALNELLHWQDWAATGLVVLAIATVLWPQKIAPQSTSTETKMT
jgi:hypothetical protein